ncbi:hypothetical protein F383_13698 [Gossypium arboreum]|uniref:Uncharacterized protein n=1 Tax=Gossypium arboreum TaxID=29729 RepID=A0A0B0NAQ5_GOSAR|nr:hypothetical protein F383_13698 [Gossypium arboreum]
MVNKSVSLFSSYSGLLSM